MPNNEITTEQLFDVLLETTKGLDKNSQELPDDSFQEQPIGYDWKILTPKFDLTSTKSPVLPTTVKTDNITTTQRAFTTRNSISRVKVNVVLVLGFSWLIYTFLQ